MSKHLLVIITLHVTFCLYVEGSVFSAPNNGPFEKALSSDWADMVDEYQKLALESRLGIPIIYGIDAVHGNNSVYGATIFPHNVGLGATRLVFTVHFVLCVSLCVWFLFLVSFLGCLIHIANPN